MKNINHGCQCTQEKQGRLEFLPQLALANPNVCSRPQVLRWAISSPTSTYVQRKSSSICIPPFHLWCRCRFVPATYLLWINFTVVREQYCNGKTRLCVRRWMVLTPSLNPVTHLFEAESIISKSKQSCLFNLRKAIALPTPKVRFYTVDKNGSVTGFTVFAQGYQWLRCLL